MKEKNEFNSKTNSDSFLESKVDILRCISSLSNDEVFTPPNLVSDMLDLLPEEIWRDKNVTFLDPCCKTGVFLREITKRLIVGLSDEIPDLQERINHILTKQVFGIAITELTGLVSRRTVYCSKDANSKYSICTEFKEQGNKAVCYKIEDIEPNQRYRAVEHEGQYYYYPQEHEGNILYPRTEHEWKNGSCVKCGASQKVQDRGSELESHAYSFIHTDIKELFGDMKFDVIIGNPPYQLKVGNENNSKAIPIYNKFVEKAIALNPKYITMIIPSKWLSQKSMKPFKRTLFDDKKLSHLIEYVDAKDCFPSIQLEGGICYFLWNSKSKKECFYKNITNKEEFETFRTLDSDDNHFIRDIISLNVVNKVASFEEPSFSSIMSGTKPFGLATNYVEPSDEIEDYNDRIALYVSKANGEIKHTFKSEIKKNHHLIPKYKVLISKSYGAKGIPTQVINKPILATPNSCCTETYIIASSFDKEEEAQNLISYMNTKFFRFLVHLNKPTQDALSNVYSLVPLQDFAKPWTDEELYRKYNLSDEEVKYIESMIRPMP